MSDVEARAVRVAEATARAWEGEVGASAGVGLPIGVVGALALLAKDSADDADLASRLLATPGEEIAELLMEIWCIFTIARPELAFRFGPLARWLNEEPRSQAHLAAAARVARAAVKAGLLELIPDPAAALEVDVLGPLYERLRPGKAKQARGEFYTPGPVAEMMAAISVGALRPGQSICDPTAGMGGLLRACAQALCAEGRDPAAFWWYGCDIEPLAVAGLAVNAQLWGLGPHVVIGCANVLAEPDWEVRAREEQTAALDGQRSRVAAARLIAATTGHLERAGEGF